MRDRLEQRACAAEGEAHRDAREEAWQAGAGEDLADRGPAGVVPVPGEVAHQVADADARGPLREVPQAHQRGGGEEEYEDEHPGGAATALGARQRLPSGCRYLLPAHFLSSTST